MQIKLLDDKAIGIFFEYAPRIVGLVRALPGARFSQAGRFWHVPVDGNSQETIKTLLGAGFVAEERVLSRLSQSAPVSVSNFASNLPLYPFQKEIAEFMANTGSCLNASFVGSGKTLTSLAVCEHLKAKKILIIAPKSVVLQWAQVEIPKWLPAAQVTAIQGDARDRRDLYIMHDRGYMVIGYETARLDIDQLEIIDWDVIITDEAHRLANPGTKLYKALKKLKARRRFALTATPIMNKAEDMFGIVNWLRPGCLGNYYQFLDRYVVKGGFQGRQIVGNKNMAELAARCQPYIIRRTLEEVGMQLPPLTEEILPVQLGTAEVTLYDRIRAELLFDIEPHIISKIENPVMLQMTIVKLGKLFELCDSMELIGDGLESSKLEVLKEHLESTLINGQKAIIITRFSRMAEILTKELSGFLPLCISGKLSGDARAKVLDNFQGSETHRLLIGTEAIGQGLNLQVANILYNYDSAWNPAKMEQRAGRIYRNGQAKPVFVYNLVCQKTVETWLQKKLSAKAELSAALLPKTLAEIKEMLE